ncbi:DUF2381 family protein [Vitiosangium sp. GDMCC 1.1324]|uniref:DUF2381 family protein n=1 Tax=Vitiosangium sp. (strain GDMCC 1.1324) TaxID=2138576 RepID=UPI00130EFC62|nr:DUF2381 family protein [Vitiosangium sp. GDMCC 1.1324]
MFPGSPPAILLLTLLQGFAAGESPPTVAACADKQRIELSLGSTATYEVCVGAGLMTVLRFDAPITLVELQDEVRFEEVVRGRHLLTLLSPPDMVPGERIRLTVRFASGVTQQSATFVLVAYRGQATNQVEVFRDKRTRESFLQEIDQERAKRLALHEENQQLRGEVEQLRRQLDQSVGLMGLYIGGALDLKGIGSKPLTWKKIRPVGGILPMSIGTSYRYKDSVAVKVQLTNFSAEPWTAVGASLTAAKGEKMEGVRFYQDKPIPPNEMGPVFVEVRVKPGEPRGEVTLNLWEDGPRTIIIPSVTFP